LKLKQLLGVDAFLKFLIPFLFGFLFDLPWFSQVGISLSFVLATVFVGDFVDALLALWQAFAVGGVVFLIIGLFSDANVSALAAAISVVVLWICLLSLLRSRPKFDSNKSNQEIIIGALLIAYLLLISPRGVLENLAFIHHEDNAKQLTAPFQVIESGVFRLELLNVFDRGTVGFFVKFLFVGLNEIQSKSGSSETLLAINAVSNAWVFVTGSFFVFMVRLLAVAVTSLKIKSHVIIWSTGLILSLWSFYIVHLAGFLPLSILNTVVLVFLLTIWSFSKENLLETIIFLLIGTSVAMAMFGSWQPWFPVGLSAIAVCIYRVVGRANVKKFGPLIAAFALFFVIFFIVKFESFTSRLDLESYGPAFVPSERLILFGLILAFFVCSPFVSTNGFISRCAIRSPTFVVARLNLGLGILALALALFFFRNQNQTHFLAFLVLLISVSSITSISLLIGRIQEVSTDERHDALVVFSVFSFGYVVAVYLLSRYMGPNYSPQYAAHKAATALSAQFLWILIIPIFVLVSNRKSLFQHYFLILVSLIAIYNVNVGIQLESTSAQWWLLRYQPIVSEWWHQNFIDYHRNQKAPVVLCSNTSIDSNDYQTYVCNRFSHSLNQDEVARVLRYQQASMSGPSPYEITSIERELVPRRSDQDYVILFRGTPSTEIKELFSLADGSFYWKVVPMVVSD